MLLANRMGMNARCYHLGELSKGPREERGEVAAAVTTTGRPATAVKPALVYNNTDNTRREGGRKEGMEGWWEESRRIPVEVERSYPGRQ